MDYFDNRTKENIADLIGSGGNIDYDSLISDKGYYYFYHLSSLRHALLCWYPFRNGIALEIDAGYGAMTGLYLEKIGNVDVTESDTLMYDSVGRRFPDGRITGYNTDFSAFDPEKKYDYVIAVDSGSLYSGDIREFLGGIKKLLCDNGTAIVGFRNRNGIKYECGALDEYVTEPFRTEKLIDKRDFVAAAEELFGYVKCYYPFPDHVYTQAVFSDNSLPGANLRDRVLPIDPFDSPLIKKEIEEYGKAVKEGNIADRCNFCLAILSDHPQKRPAPEQAILSFDRGDRSFVTVFYDNDSVIKSAVTERGKEILRQSFRNLEDLRSRGISTVDQKLENGALYMRWVRTESWLERIRKIVEAGDRGGLIDVFRKVKDIVMISSDADGSGYDPDKWGIPAEKAGVILKKGYTDLIPLNAFCDDDVPVFYDQEFCEEYCPAVYPLFRGILYTYMNIPETENVIPRREILDIFGIDADTEKALTEFENEFIEKTRNLGLYRQMYGWAYGITDDRIETNRKTPFEYGAVELLQKTHRVQLDTLKVFDEFCKENGLSYFAAETTLLGAVRHGGFIPWEDALEVGMSRADYDRFVELYKNGEDKPFLQTMYNDGAVFCGGYARLRAQNTTAAEERDLLRPGNKGIWIDIYPFDFCEADSTRREAHFKRISAVRNACYAAIYGDESAPVSSIETRGERDGSVSDGLSPERLRELLEREFRRIKDSDKCAVLACENDRIMNKTVVDAEDLRDLTDAVFEDTVIPIPSDYDEWLKKRFGNSYMELPVIRRRKRRNIRIDPEHSWQTGGTGTAKGNA